jgi:dTDP-4-dehydrorhamnose 3,5-epimerase
MKMVETRIPGVLLVELDRFGDERGWFMETWQVERYAPAGIAGPFVQDNLALSGRGVLRGLHIQNPHGQGKLVQVYAGRVFDVAVDVRVGSPTFGQWVGVTLDAAEPRQFYVPPGFLHGYYVLSEQAMFGYKCTDLYHPETQFSVRWDDPGIGIEWPLDAPPVLSDKDRDAAVLSEIPTERLPRYAD